MCGIFGYTNYKDDGESLLRRMADQEIHRGPDDLGTYDNHPSQVHFGLRRLSIIDIEGGHQPISNEDETVWIACNGEIYNYIEIKEQLLQKGHRFRNDSDVEVLVHMYEEYGLNFLENINGMFGFVLFDCVNQRLVLARDRLGIKFLYYSWDGKRLAFASEIKPLLLCPWISRQIDWHAISQYLNLLYVPSPKTGFENINKLESATMLILENNKVRFHCYWHLHSFLNNSSEKNISFENASDSLNELLDDACRLQLRSDVPVGAFLSGGIDSSAVVALTKKHASFNMDTFTVFWKEAAEKMDERIFAKKVAKMYECSYNETTLSYEDFDRLLPLLAWHIEEPNADGAFVPTYVISRFAREKCKVILTGAGGDELFGGYSWYNPGGFSIKKLILTSFCSKSTQAYFNRAFNFPWRLVFPMYQPDVTMDFVNSYFRTMPGKDRANNEMAFDLKYWLQDDILLITDKMSMAASLEARVPLLDHRIVELALSLPSEYKLNDTDNKTIFKHSIGRYLPEDVLRRQKDGFGAPIGSWMKHHLELLSRNILENGELMREGIITRKTLTKVYSLVNLKKSWIWSLWILLNLELWVRFVYKKAPKPEGVTLTSL